MSSVRASWRSSWASFTTCFTIHHRGEVIARDDRTLDRLGLGHAQIAEALDRLLTSAWRASTDRLANARAPFEAEMRASGMRGVPGLAMLPLGASLDELDERLRNGDRLPADRGTAIDGHDVFLQVYLGYQYCPFTALHLPWSDDAPARRLLRRRSAGVAYITEPIDRELPCGLELSYRHANLEFLIIRRDTRQSLRGSGLLVHLIRDHRFFEGKHSQFRIDPEQAAHVLSLTWPCPHRPHPPACPGCEPGRDHRLADGTS